jgi:hypothetical protein
VARYQRSQQVAIPQQGGPYADGVAGMPDVDMEGLHGISHGTSIRTS